MAGFVLRVLLGASFVPTPYAGAFGDVHAGDYNADYIQSLSPRRGSYGGLPGRQLLSGRGPHAGPDRGVHLEKGIHGTDYGRCCDCRDPSEPRARRRRSSPSGGSGELFVEAVTAGCGPDTYCPDVGVSPNEQMATFLARRFISRTYEDRAEERNEPHTSRIASAAASVAVGLLLPLLLLERRVLEPAGSLAPGRPAAGRRVPVGASGHFSAPRRAAAGAMMLARGSAPGAGERRGLWGRNPPRQSAAPAIEVRHSLRNATSRPLSRGPRRRPRHRAAGHRNNEGRPPTIRALRRGRTPSSNRTPRRTCPPRSSTSKAPATSTACSRGHHDGRRRPRPAVGQPRVQIFDKSGNVAAGPFDGNTLFTDLGGDCANINGGDIIVMYDQLAYRRAGARDLRRHRQPRVHGGVDERRPARHVLPLRLPVQRVRARLPALRHVARRVLHDRRGVRQRLPDDGHGLRPPGHAQRPAPDLRGATNSTFDGLLAADLDGPNPPPGGSRTADGRRHAGHVASGVGPPHVAHASHFAAPENSTFTGADGPAHPALQLLHAPRSPRAPPRRWDGCLPAALPQLRNPRDAGHPPRRPGRQWPLGCLPRRCTQIR